MFKAKFLKTGDAKGTTVDLDLQPGRYTHLFLNLSGTTDTGQTLTLADLGTVRIVRNGESRIFHDLEFFADWTDIQSGAPSTVTGGAAAAEEVTLVIPFGVPEFQNSMDVGNVDEVDITFNFGSNLSTRFGSNAFTYTLFGFVDDSVPESYVLEIAKQNIQAAAAGRIESSVNGPNVAAVYLKDGSNVTDRYQLRVDGQVIVDNIDPEYLVDFTNVLKTVESTQSLAEINLVVSGDISAAQNSEIEASANFTSSGTLEQTVFRILPSRLAQRSRAAVSAERATRSAGAGRSLGVTTRR